jgi:mRNA-degrading endonuclease toxin of MazEF toxin-antitoxin module
MVVRTAGGVASLSEGPTRANRASGLKQESYVKSEHLRSISHERLRQRWGTVDVSVIRAVEKRLVWLLAL